MASDPKLTPDDEELVRKAKEFMKECEKLPPPPRSLQDKMQDQVPTDEEWKKLKERERALAEGKEEKK